MGLYEISLANKKDNGACLPIEWHENGDGEQRTYREELKGGLEKIEKLSDVRFVSSELNGGSGTYHCGI